MKTLQKALVTGAVLALTSAPAFADNWKATAGIGNEDYKQLTVGYGEFIIGSNMEEAFFLGYCDEGNIRDCFTLRKDGDLYGLGLSTAPDFLKFGDFGVNFGIDLSGGTEDEVDTVAGALFLNASYNVAPMLSLPSNFALIGEIGMRKERIAWEFEGESETASDSTMNTRVTVEYSF